LSYDAKFERRAPRNFLLANHTAPVKLQRDKEFATEQTDHIGATCEVNSASANSLALNDEDSLVVNPVLFSNLPQMVIVSGSVFQQRIADVLC